MHSEPLVLTFDMGTQSARAMLVNARGEILAKKQKYYERPYFSKNPGWAEQKADFYWNAVCETSQALKAEQPGLWGQIGAVTCTCIRDTCLCVDAQGEPLRDVILWLDNREATDLSTLPRVNSLLFRLVQQKEVAEAVRKASPCNWIMKHEPEVWKRTHKFILISAYFNVKFTGRIVDCTANIIGHIPFDVKTRAWSKPGDLKHSLFPVADEKLCELVEPGTVIGGISKTAAQETGISEGVPLVASGSDKGCETLALTCLQRETAAALSFGTTATIQISTDRYFELMPYVPPFAGVAGKFNPELEIYRGYWLISWFKREFAAKEVSDAAVLGVSPEDLLNQRLQEVPAGCDGLMLQPYFTPGISMPHAKGAMIGFSEVHTRIHIYRAIVEGVNYGLMEGLFLIEKRGKLKIEKIFVAGGGAQSGEICQITANMFGLPVCRIHTHEACGVGSSLVAFVANGTYRSYEEAAKNMIHIKQEYLPDPEEHRLYKKLYENVYAKVFDLLTPLYKELNAILAES